MKLISLFCLCVFSLTTFGYSFDNNVPKEVKEQIINDMAFMGTIEGNGTSELNKKIFGSVAGKAYTDFFEKRVAAIGMHTCGNPNAVACVIPLLDSTKIWLTKNYVKFSHPQIAKMMVVFHEARHTERENAFWSHATCPTPFIDENGKEIISIWTGAKLAGQAACDKTPFGSYGSSLILLKNVQKFCMNCSEKIKMDAGLYADDQFKRIIAQAAIDEIKNDLYKLLEWL